MFNRNTSVGLQSAKRLNILCEYEKLTEGNSLLYVDQLQDEYETRGLYIKTLTMDDLKLDESRCGIHGSPTKVYKVESVVLAGSHHKIVPPTKEGIGDLIDNLLADHILG